MYNNPIANGVDNRQRADNAMLGIVGNAVLAKGDQREIKAWRTAFKRVNEQLYAAGYQHTPVEKPE